MLKVCHSDRLLLVLCGLHRLLQRYVGRVNSAREQKLSIGGGAGYDFLGVVHMEEGVQVRVQVEVGREEQGEGETHGKRTKRGTEKQRETINRSSWTA